MMMCCFINSHDDVYDDEDEDNVTDDDDDDAVDDDDDFCFVVDDDDDNDVDDKIRPPSSFQVSYAVDQVLYIESLSDWLTSSLLKEDECGGDDGGGVEAKLHLMEGINSDSGSRALPASFDGDQSFISTGRVEYGKLYGIISLCRVIKSTDEIEVMRYAAYVASNAHVQLMRAAAKKECSFEYELEALFLYEIYRNGGCRRCAYTCIGACGPNAAVLHYGHAAAPNDRLLQESDMVGLPCLL